MSYVEIQKNSYVNKVCKTCQYFHNAGHVKTTIEYKKYNQWCCRFSRTCKEAVGECKITNGYDSMKSWKEGNVNGRL